MKKIFLSFSFLIILSVIGYTKDGVVYNTDDDGFLKVGFDIDETIINSTKTYQQAQKIAQKKGVNFDATLNGLDQYYSKPIKPLIDLIQFYHSKGHDIFFVTARSPENGNHLALYLTKLLGFKVQVNKNLFFAPEKQSGGFTETTKQNHLKKLKLDLFYGDSDNDIVAALIADIEAVRIVRSKDALKKYSAGYFGEPDHGRDFFPPKEYTDFIQKSVGPFGETIYPIQPSGE